MHATEKPLMRIQDVVCVCVCVCTKVLERERVREREREREGRLTVISVLVVFLTSLRVPKILQLILYLHPHREISPCSPAQ